MPVRGDEPVFRSESDVLLDEWGLLQATLTRTQAECTRLLMENRELKAGWTQQRITDWANSTFGKSVSNLRVATRANEEMAELLSELSVDDSSEKAVEECADVYIVLCRVVENLGFDFQRAVDRKMDINSARRWNLDGSGHGYHVKES